jgi:thiamine-phosphate pyrophosphorylase
VIPDRFERLADASLYLVCEALPGARLEAALRGGVGIVQLRCKGAADADVIAAGRRFARVCERFGVPLILNDRPDLVAAVGADGVHLGQDDIGVEEARELLGADRIVGLSTHSPTEIDSALAVAVDYVGVGPVHATPTKPGRAAVGTELVTYAAARARIPFFAIGGIDRTNLDAVLDAGAERVAVVRALTRASDPESAARELRARLGRHSQALGTKEVGVGDAARA